MCACVHWKLYNDAIIVNYKVVSVIDLVAILLFELKFKLGDSYQLLKKDPLLKRYRLKIFHHTSNQDKI